MSRAQVPTLDLVHGLEHYFPLYASMFAGTSKKLQRGAREGLWSSLGHWLHFERWRGQMWREHIRQAGDLKPSALRPCEVWVLVLKLISFSHCFSLLPSTFGLFLLPTVLQVLWNLFHYTHTLYLHTFWHLPLPSPSSVCSFSPLCPLTCPSQLYPSASHISLGGYLTYLWASICVAVLWVVRVPCTEWQNKGRAPRAYPRLLLVHWEAGWQLWKFRNSFLVKQKCHMKETNVCTAPGGSSQRQAWSPTEFPSTALTQRGMGRVSDLSS